MERKNLYAELLKDPRWQRKRLEILNRDNFTCQHCGDTEETLHIHHLRYYPGAAPWEVNDDDMVTLCETCHYFEPIIKKHLTAYNEEVLDIGRKKEVVEPESKGLLAYSYTKKKYKDDGLNVIRGFILYRKDQGIYDIVITIDFNMNEMHGLTTMILIEQKRLEELKNEN